MIAHVAEAGEHKGRVVLRLGVAERPSRVGLEAAVSVARAFGSEIESVFVEDLALVALASYPFAREVALTGRCSRALSKAGMEQDIRVTGSALFREVEAIAGKADVRVHRRIVRDDPLPALAAACADCGPWNVVALAEPLRAGQAAELRELFLGIADTTGIVVTGPVARRGRGPVAAIVEDTERLPSALRTAERLAAVTGGDVRVLLVGENDEQAAWMEGQARLMLDGNSHIGVSTALASVGIRAMLDALRRIECGFLIAQFGGAMIPDDADLGPLTASLECPLFLVR